MPSTRPPTPTIGRRACPAGLLALLVLTGCLGGPGGPGGLGGLGGSGGFDEPDIPEEAARERALATEERHLRDRLGNASCVDGWGLSSYTGVEAEATVRNRTAAGVYVDVVHPYWYGTAEVDADGRSEATYLVTADEARRLHGTEVSPC